MRYCPQCRYEYTLELETCPDCGTRLLSGSLPPEGGVDDDVKSVILLETTDTLKAQFLASALDQEGIAHFGQGLGLTDSIGGGLGVDMPHGAYSSTGPIRIWVNPNDYERAKEVLESLQGDELQEGELLNGSPDDEQEESSGNSTRKP